MSKQMVKDLKRASSTSDVGGKAASLGQMIKAGFNVPAGFTISAQATIGPRLEAQIYKSFDRLGSERVAVRSSAVAEDGAQDAWAGQFDTFLNVKREALLDAINKCRTSVSSGRAQAYAKTKGLKSGGIAVIVQTMVPAEISGVAFSVHPITKDPNTLIVEAVHGLAESLVSGVETPDAYIIDKRSLEVIDSELVEAEPIVNGSRLKKLAKQIIEIEKWAGFPVDVEWSIAEGQIYILQSRPITTLSR